MLRPSTAPRWKIAINSLRRAPTAAAARPRNDGAKPSDSIAIAPDFKKTLRFMMTLEQIYECANRRIDELDFEIGNPNPSIRNFVN